MVEERISSTYTYPSTDGVYEGRIAILVLGVDIGPLIDEEFHEL